MLVDASEVLLGLLNDVLDFSKIEAGKMTLERIAFDPGEKLDALIRMWRPRAEAKGLTLSLETPGDLPPIVQGDSLRLQQVLFNLLSNAVKFTDRGRVAVRATWSDSRLVVEVEDTGCGIPHDRLTQVFDSFEQADVGTTRRYGGTGLGLAISRRLAALMEGGLEVESVPGRGSVFRFEGRFPAVAATAPRPEAEATDAGGLEGLQVLAAEDHPVNRRILALLLEPLGCRLAVVENGAEAVAAAAERPFDVILLDMQMPVMDGLDAARAIRAGAGPCRDTPIVALTANALDVHRQAWLAVGAAGFLTKPIDAAALASTLSAAARGAPAMAATG
jgi:CheY-like chemotaxis protein/anti-sigma regulatory factor (Ser/Thr protein kinase)